MVFKKKSKRKIKWRINSTTIILFSFLLVILIGAGLLTLPFASNSGTWTDFTTALFTATSATCVTGLVVVDTLTHWSIFGQIILILLIQVGGLGIMTIISLIAIFLAKSSSLHSRTMAMQAAGAASYQSVAQTLKNVFIGTSFFEFVGAVLLSIRFIPRFGILNGIWKAVFHSISAFCNAGFDILGTENGSSLAQFANDPLVLLTIAGLIIVGGIGYIIWGDVAKHKFKFSRYSLHSKIALITTFWLLFLGTISFFGLEYNHAFKDMPLGYQILNSFFQAVTLRTAGFAAVDQASLSPAGTIISDILMFIGGTTGSTAGGLKTTTFAVLILLIYSIVKRRNDVIVLKRKISSQTIKNASAIAIVYIFAVLASSVAICAIDGFTASDAIFETISASATVGLTKGITASLSIVSRYIIIFLMFAGRIGGLSFILAFSKTKISQTTDRPTENVFIG